jgi:hypothetical protein
MIVCLSASSRQSGWLSDDLGFLAGLWGGFSVRDADFNLPQHRHDCSDLSHWMGMTGFSSKWILSHSTWYKFRRSCHMDFDRPLSPTPQLTFLISKAVPFSVSTLLVVPVCRVSRNTGVSKFYF